METAAKRQDIYLFEMGTHVCIEQRTIDKSSMHGRNKDPCLHVNRFHLRLNFSTSKEPQDCAGFACFAILYISDVLHVCGSPWCS